MRKVIKTIIAGCMGNAMEFFSVTLFGSLVFQIGETFFPNSQHKVLLSLCVFGCSYIVRPLGGLILGYIGDKNGRAKVLSWSVAVMGVSSAVIAILPGYNTIGPASFGILIICRVVQGICVGAEYSGALIFGQEHVSKQERGMMAGWISGSCFFGFSLGLLFAKVVDFLPPWGWRLGFFLSAIMTLVASVVRRDLGETPEFLEQNFSIKSKVICWKESLRVFVFSCMDGTATYTLGGFLFVYCTQYLDMDKAPILNLLIIFVTLTAFMCVWFARLSEKIGGIRLMRYGLWVGTLLPPICFDWLAESKTFFCASVLFFLMSVLTSLFVGVVPMLMFKMAPVSRRMITISFGYNVGLAITGGLIPVLFSLLIEKTHLKSIPGHVLSTIFFVLLYGANRIRKYMKATESTEELI